MHINDSDFEPLAGRAAWLGDPETLTICSVVMICLQLNADQ